MHFEDALHHHDYYRVVNSVTDIRIAIIVTNIMYVTTTCTSIRISITSIIISISKRINVSDDHTI